jgi:hypothetical protein
MRRGKRLVGAIMADGSKVTGARTGVGVVCALGAFLTLAWAFFYVVPGTDGVERWQKLGLAALAVVIALGVVAILRFALAPLAGSNSSQPSADADAAIRGRIAPLVLAVGTIAIVALALALIISFVIMASKEPPNGPVASKIDTLLTTVFTTVLPVVATWVGTVLAFYFGSENYRQAAESTRAALGDRLIAKKNVSQAVKHYDEIAKFEVDDEAAAENLTIFDMIHTFSSAAPRVIIFKKSTKTPIYVIRSTTPPMPPNWVTPEYGQGSDPNLTKDTKLKAYLDFNNGDNRNDARKFRFIKADATIDEAIALMRKEGVDDLFITKDGLPASPVLGWAATKDLIKA